MYRDILLCLPPTLRFLTLAYHGTYSPLKESATGDLIVWREVEQCMRLFGNIEKVHILIIWLNSDCIRDPMFKTLPVFEQGRLLRVRVGTWLKKQRGEMMKHLSAHYRDLVTISIEVQMRKAWKKGNDDRRASFQLDGVSGRVTEPHVGSI